MTLEELRDKAHSLSQTPRGVWGPGAEYEPLSVDVNLSNT